MNISIARGIQSYSNSTITKDCACSSIIHRKSEDISIKRSRDHLQWDNVLTGGSITIIAWTRKYISLLYSSRLSQKSISGLIIFTTKLCLI